MDPNHLASWQGWSELFFSFGTVNQQEDEGIDD
jgi:hypothetical protein